MSIHDALCALRTDPQDLLFRSAFLRLVYPHVRRAARSFADADDVAHDAMERIAHRWPSCRATCEGACVRWVQRVTVSCGIDRQRRRRPELRDDIDTTPVEPARDRPELLVAYDQSARVARAAWRLPPDLKARARASGVASTVAGRDRDVSVFEARRIHDRTVEDVVRRHRVSPDVVFKATSRGRAAVGIGAALLARDETEPFLRSALHDLAELAAPPVRPPHKSPSDSARPRVSSNNHPARDEP